MDGDASGNDHDLLDTFLNVVLDRYKDGWISHSSARSALAGVVNVTCDDDTVARHMRAFISHDPRDDV